MHNLELKLFVGYSVLFCSVLSSSVDCVLVLSVGDERTIGG